MFEWRRKAFLPYGKQYLGHAEYRAVRRVLKSPFLTQGPEVEHFEAALKKVTTAPYAVAVANGTVALDLAVRAVKILYGLEDKALGLTSPNTFVATGNALLYNKLTPLFCDINPRSGNLDLEEVEILLQRHNTGSSVAEIRKAELQNKVAQSTKAQEVQAVQEVKGQSIKTQSKPAAKRPIEILLPVHFAGETLDMAEIWQLARQYHQGREPLKLAPIKAKAETESAKAAEPESPHLPIIEDAAHALGSFYRLGERLPVGSCAYSDACCFSFHPVKTATTAEGGAITCKDPQLYRLLLMLRNHGINREVESWQNLSDNCWTDDLVPELGVPPWYSEMQHLGHNARLSDVHAAIGTVQLKRLAGFAAKRRQIAQHYNMSLSGLEWLILPELRQGTCPHLYVVQINFGYLRLSRSAVMRELLSEGIGTQVHYIPVPMQPYYRGLGYDMNGLNAAKDYYHGALSLPLYTSLSFKEQEHIIRCVRRLGELAE